MTFGRTLLAMRFGRFSLARTIFLWTARKVLIEELFSFRGTFRQNCGFWITLTTIAAVTSFVAIIVLLDNLLNGA